MPRKQDMTRRTPKPKKHPVIDPATGLPRGRGRPRKDPPAVVYDETAVSDTQAQLSPAGDTQTLIVPEAPAIARVAPVVIEVANTMPPDPVAGVSPLAAEVILRDLDDKHRKQVERESRRRAMCAEAARYRWIIAQEYHRLANGNRLSFDDYPFQPPIYQDDATELVVYGSVQWGKTEFLICAAMAMAAVGLKVFFVLSKIDKRERLTKTRIDPALNSVPIYKALVEAAEKAGRKTDSVRIKHIGDGSIVFVVATADRDFTSVDADVVIVDEYQECEGDNLQKVDNRLSGSPWQFKIFVGNPLLRGTESNQNLDFQFQQSDQRQWHIECGNCKTLQVLNWWKHVVDEDRNPETGAILSIRPKDPTWQGPGVLDLNPICDVCDRPVDRLSRDAEWRPMNPGHPRHGYQLSNLYNCNKRLDDLFQKYLLAKHKPSLMQDFINNQLGLAHNQDGTAITQDMLAACSTGRLLGVEPFAFVPASMLKWRTAA